MPDNGPGQRFNCHVHTFNLKTALTPRSLEVLRKRMEHDIKPDWLGKAVGELLSDLVEEVPNLNEEYLLRKLLEKVTGQPDFKSLGKKLGVKMPDEVSSIITGAAQNLVLGQLRKGVTWLVGRFRSDKHVDYRESDLQDMLETLRIAAKPDIRAVTDWLMNQLDPQDSVVPLTLDITAGNPEDTPVFEQQLSETSQSILAYPGRVLPFVAVNPLRSDQLTVNGQTLNGYQEIMEYALEEMGFVGVKLYPSLGFLVDAPEMASVYSYCQPRGIPMLMHCNSGGFVVSEEATQYPHPKHWVPLLDKYEGLKICFGHFAGAGTLSSEEIPPDAWVRTIFSLMEQHSGAYADIAFHRKPMDGDDIAQRYLKNITEIFNDPKRRDKVLFGTDFWLIRPRLSEGNHWRFFEDLLGPEIFSHFTQANPHRFLGLPPEGGNQAMEKHIDFVVRNQDDLEAMPAEWLLEAIEERHGAAKRQEIEGYCSRFLPAASLPVDGWKQCLAKIGDLTIKQGFGDPFEVNLNHPGSTTFNGAKINFEAAAKLSAEVMADPAGSDEDGILLQLPTPNSELDLKPQLSFVDGKAWLKYRLEAKLGADVELDSIGLNLAADKSVVFTDYRAHDPEDRLINTIKGDLARPRLALKCEDVLRLGPDEAVSFQVQGKLSGQLTLTWQDVLSSGFNLLSDLLGSSQPLAVKMELGATVSAQVAVSDDFTVIFSRQDGEFRVAVRKLDSRSESLQVQLSAGVGFDDPEMITSIVDQLVSQYLDVGLAELEDLLKQDGSDDGILAKLEDKLAVAGYEAVVKKVGKLQEKVSEATAAIAEAKLTAGFSYEYSKIEKNTTLLEATLEERTLEQLHYLLIQGDLTELLERIRRQDPDIQLVEYLRQREIVRHQAWGLTLGPMGGKDTKERRFAEQWGLDSEGVESRVKLSFAGLRGYNAEYFGDDWQWKVDFQAQMTELAPVKELRLGPLSAADPCFEYGLAFLFEWDHAKLTKEKLAVVLDAATLWGVFGDVGAPSEKEFTRFEELKLRNKAVKLRLQLVFDHPTLGAIIDGAVAVPDGAVADAFASAMGYCNRGPNLDPAIRKEVYAPLWRLLFEKAQDEKFKISAELKGLTKAATIRVREMGYRGPANLESRNWAHTFGGVLRLQPPIANWRRFVSGLQQLQRVSGELQGPEAIKSAINRMFQDLSPFCAQAHHVRTAGAYLLGRARAAGAMATVQPTLTANWKEGTSQTTQTLTMGTTGPA